MKWQFYAAFRLQHHADMGQGHVEDSPLDCSMAQVQQPTMSSHTLDRPFLLSSGRGDMVGHFCSTCLECTSMEGISIFDVNLCWAWDWEDL